MIVIEAEKLLGHPMHCTALAELQQAYSALFINTCASFKLLTAS